MSTSHSAEMRSLTTKADRGTEVPLLPSGFDAVRLLMNASQECGVAGIIADRVEKRIHANERHIEAVAVHRVLKRFEGMVEFVHAKIIDADLESGARVR